MIVRNKKTKAENISSDCRGSEQHCSEKCNYTKMDCKVNGPM